MKSPLKTLRTQILVVAALLTLTGSAVTSTQHVHSQSCNLFPKNDLYYPISNGAEPTGISKQDFDTVLDAIQMVYGPEVKAEGGTLKILRAWSNGEVNAGASRSPFGNTFILHMFGGMARHPQMTKESFLLIACHEMGHHLGKSPRYPGTPMASEGQADYFATLKCMRKVLTVFNTARETAGLSRIAGRLATQACKRFQRLSLDGTNDGAAICLRSHTAAETLGGILGSLTNDKRKAKNLPPLPLPKLNTPDLSVVPRTIIDAYPGVQCRLDTYSAGALCPVGVDTNLDEKSPNSGVCLMPSRRASLAESNAGSIEDQLGVRPPCWYNQKEMESFSAVNGRLLGRRGE